MKPAFAYLRFQLTTIASSAVLIAALCVSASAQEKTWPALLGNGNGNSDNKTSPKYGISYNSRDFEFVADKRLMKSHGWMDNHQVPHLKPELSNLFDAIRQPDRIGHWIDEGYESQRDRAIRTGGKPAERARSFNPRSLRVDVVARPFKMFYQGEWIWAGGSYDSKSRHIKVVNAAIVNLDTPRSAYLSRLPDWIVSEMSRVFCGSSDPSAPCQ